MYPRPTTGRLTTAPSTPPASELQPVLSKPLNLASVNAADYDLVFYPGGHGPMEDLAVDKTSGRILTERMEDTSGAPHLPGER